MNTNPYIPPTVKVSAAPKQNVAAIHGLPAIVIAALVGGAFAAGYLVFSNLNQLGHPRRAKQTLFVFAIVGIIALYIAWRVPSDVISFYLLVGIPQLIVVTVLAWYVQSQLDRAHRSLEEMYRSKWFAFSIGVVSNLAIKAFFYALHYLSSSIAVG